MELVTCDKYYDKVLEHFPELSRKQLDKIIKHGLMELYLHNLYGGDVLLKHPKYTMYFGKLFNNQEIFGRYWRIKWRIKLRIKYRRNKTKYAGYYYFGVTDEIFKQLRLDTYKSRKCVTLEKVKLYKILDECFLNGGYNHFFKIKYPEDCGFTMYKENYKLRNLEYVYKRKSDKTIEPVSYETKRDKCVKRRPK